MQAACTTNHIFLDFITTLRYGEGCMNVFNMQLASLSGSCSG